MPEETEEADESYCFPASFAKFPCTAVWDDLDKDNEAFTVQEVVTDSQLAQIANSTGVSMDRDLAGRQVYIGGNDRQSVCKALGKLKVLLSVKVRTWIKLAIPPLSTLTYFPEVVNHPAKG